MTEAFFRLTDSLANVTICSNYLAKEIEVSYGSIN